MLRLYPALLAFALLAAPAFAQDDPLAECDGPTPVMNACIFEKYEQADAELNRVWQRVLATIRPSDFMPAEAANEWREHLIAAQRAWVTFKEEDCNGAVAYEWYGGSGANAAVGVCLYAKTVARTEDLSLRYLGDSNN
jgi:uncharacterized protein YecT (DUF1311 family)